MTWRAYYLDPTAPARGISWEERSLQKLVASRPPSACAAEHGVPSDQDREQARQLRERLARIGRQAGIEFSFGGRIGNTRSAHRAIAFSRNPASLAPTTTTNTTTDTTNNTTNTSTPSTNPAPRDPSESQDRFVTALFAAYFEGTADVTSHESLADVAASAGLDRARMLAWLDGGEGGDEVDAEDRATRDLGLRGVPSFTVQGHRLDGAQDVQDFLDLFIKIKEEEGRGLAQE